MQFMPKVQYSFVRLGMWAGFQKQSFSQMGRLQYHVQIKE
ncbi:hypothetical protein CDL12_15968 [Handroanthus impetiginosus]|uniref:Uncharacterized protein n=1 Tax=Handroanthus impetiginosus TaxID=429701 RepID=A0A2G9H1M6_9LAMI|nr:hypothetical protein CDL12_15968 [Handroanthus impetiginosus]